MFFNRENSIRVRQLRNEEKLPYELLLLADETIESIDKYISNSEIYLLEHENRNIAVYVLQIISKNVIEIKNIAVNEKYQRQGIGKLLLKDAANRAIKNGFKTLTIATGDLASKQLNLYKKEGFEIYDSKENYFIDNYPEPIFENGIQLKHLLMLKKELQ